jgi:hypothetical protein
MVPPRPEARARLGQLTVHDGSKFTIGARILTPAQAPFADAP